MGRKSEQMFPGRATPMNALDKLNEQQRQAVTAPPGPTLVLAGPGSGKTRVLTHRVAYLIYEKDISPRSIVSVTFTNKAASEMKERVQRLIGHGLTGGLRIGTFHALCARLLRIEAGADKNEGPLPYDRNYLVYDTDDQLKLVKLVIEELGVNLKRLQLRSPYAVLNLISDAKNELVTPAQYPRSSYLDEVIARIYERYQQVLQNSNAMDFDDLIMQTVLLLQNDVEARNRYQHYYEHVLVDEFQDTNMAQYELVRLWGAPQNNVFVVGDEDQAIYGFRGADYRNVNRFRQDFKGAKTILLEQNYRSTQTVLDTARAVIDRNTDRTQKSLFTDRGAGLKVYAFEAYDERHEAEFIVKEVERLRIAGSSYNDIAVMYRTNLQSRALEQAFVDYRVAYQLIGGTAFYQRREIKDLMGYLRLIDSPADTVSFDRVINVPKRGIGSKTQAAFQAWADAQGIPYGDAIVRLADAGQVPGISAGATRKLAKFGELLQSWRQMADAGQYTELLDSILEETDYDSHLASIAKTDDELNDRRANVEQLQGVMAEGDFETLSDFLTNSALATSLDSLSEDDEGKVTLLTLHASKGLEYPQVFITGLEEGLLPHSRAIEDGPEGLAEERRLLYVGITRAKDRLYITRAQRRRLGQYANTTEPSRFLYDLPADLMEGSGTAAVTQPSYESYHRSTAWDAISPREQPRDEKIIPFPKQRYRSNMVVRHATFGVGIVLESKLRGDDEEVTVMFEGKQLKRLMASFANLEIVPE